MRLCQLLCDPKARILRLERRGKNSVWRLRDGSPNLLRSQGPSGRGSPLRRHAGVPGDPDLPGRVSGLRQGETGISLFPLRQPLHTKRFSYYIGRRCRASSIKDIAKELHLDCHTVKELEKQYMREQLRRAGTPGPKIIGFVEGVNTKIRVIQRRAYGIRDEEYLRLKILTCMLPEI